MPEPEASVLVRPRFRPTLGWASLSVSAKMNQPAARASPPPPHSLVCRLVPTFSCSQGLSSTADIIVFPPSLPPSRVSCNSAWRRRWGEARRHPAFNYAGHKSIAPSHPSPRRHLFPQLRALIISISTTAQQIWRLQSVIIAELYHRIVQCFEETS